MITVSLPPVGVARLGAEVVEDSVSGRWELRERAINPIVKVQNVLLHNRVPEAHIVVLECPYVDSEVQIVHLYQKLRVLVCHRCSQILKGAYVLVLEDVGGARPHAVDQFCDRIPSLSRGARTDKEDQG